MFSVKALSESPWHPLAGRLRLQQKLCVWTVLRGLCSHSAGRGKSYLRKHKKID